MSSAKPAFLLAGGMPLDRAAMVRLYARALSECGKKTPRVVYLGVASRDNKIFFYAMKSLIMKAGAGEVVFIRLARAKADLNAAKESLESADAIFISGGEVEDGMRWLVRHGLDSYLKQLFDRGKFFFGMSAGSIMMGTHWVCWEDPEDDATAELFDCLGFVPTVFDTHAEDEDWKELKTVLRLMGPGSSGYGIPNGGMISADSQGLLINLEKAPLCYINNEGQVQRV